MMFRLIFITLYILQNSFFTNGQNVQTMPPENACASSTVTLRCPQNYVVVVRSASYGVPQAHGSCSYNIGDCIADAMSIMLCTQDTTDCSIYVTRKKLPQCNDHFAEYAHIEYDCVPISMDDSSKEYNVCQNGSDLTSDHGIIKSPGYPTQFQTTTIECFRAIHVPVNKTIRLWLSDLYIGSTSTNCADDHLIVVDSVQIYRHCGYKRYAYPYLCSATVIIQYLVTTDLPTYRGMRMYFEIVDRFQNDMCPDPNGTVTLVPATPPPTTTIDPDLSTHEPAYVTFGIASPVRSLQLCKGETYDFECPNNYVLTIITNIFGVTDSGQCEPHDATKHCVITTDPTFMCHQSCVYTYTGHQTIQSCNDKIADYQYIEYQCIPTNTELISNTPCPTDGSIIPAQIDLRGRFQSYNYPNIEVMNCTYRLTTKPGHIMNFYSLDISMNGFVSNCHPNKLTLIEKDENQSTDFCEQRSYSLIYSSCSNELDLVYTVVNADQSVSYGAELYIQSQERPLDWSCGQPLPTPPNPTTNPTAPFTTPTATPLKNDSFMVALEEIEHDLCYGSLASYICPTGYTFMILDAFYGVKSQTSNKCGFVQGDCVQEALSTITQCRNDVPNCYLTYTNHHRLASCFDNYADYLHITTQCVPSRPVGTGTTVQIYDICENNHDITDIHGIVTSPDFPTFKQTNDECKRKIVSLLDRVLKIWINELAVSSDGQRSSNDDPDSNEPDLVIYKNHDTENLDDIEQKFPSIRDTCIYDYLMINAPHVAYVYCGTRKLAIAPVCAQSVVIHYKSTSPTNLFYKGFKLYFEWTEKPPEISCGGNPQPGNTTTPVDEVIPIWAQNLELSPVFSEHVCLGTSTTIRCPRGSDYVLSIIEANYGVTGTGTCEIPTSSHCHQEVSLALTCTHSCLIEYYLPESLVQCGFQNADYLTVDYECIPTRLPNHENPIDICASTVTDTITLDAGIMVSPQYPTLGAAHTCSKKIQTLSYKIWKVFIVDLYVEGETDAGNCDESSLTIYDGVDKIIRCGLHQPEQVLISCSDIVEFKFVSNHYTLGYRGFKVYFQTIDVPPGWACTPTGFSTTTTTQEPPTTTSLIPPSLRIRAYGGTTNGTRQYCTLPFTYQGNLESTCTRANPPSSTPGQDLNEPWCSLTSNFDLDHQWGFCELGVTDSTIYDVCDSRSQLLKCPSGYVIDILTADYGAKPDGNIDIGACIYDQNDCFQSDASTMQIQCAGLGSCTAYHLSRPLILCQNRQSAYFHIDYTCIPHDIPEIHKYDMCDSGSVIQNDTRRGFIMSPNYPTPQVNIDCTFNLKISKPHQDIYLYIIEMNLNGPNIIGENCIKDRLIVTADNTINEICGQSYTNLLVHTCHGSVTLQLIRTSDAIGIGVKFYFEFRDRPVDQLCPLLPIITTLPTLSPTPITTTTIGPLPDYFPDPSRRMFKTLCYPDLSGLMGAHNFHCPSNYVIVIHRAFYGHGSHCDYISGDCTSEADIVYHTCAGKESCSVSFINIVLLPECNNVQANYLFVEYQCLPTSKIVLHNADLCTGKLDPASVSGIFRSSSYPTYAPTQCANTTLSLLDDSNLVIYIYSLDFNIGAPNIVTGECSEDYLLLSYQCNGQIYDRRLCGTHPTELLFSTCKPTDKIFASYSLVGQDPQAQRGFALLYHILAKFDASTHVPTLPTTTDPITPPEPGPLSTDIKVTTTCVPHAIIIECDSPGYVIVIHKVQLAVSATNSCTHSTNDCFEDRTNYYNYCGGRTFCDLFPHAIPILPCNNSQANYLYVEYQCIPTVPKLNLDVCSSNKSFERVYGGAMISSLNYTSEYKQCKVELRSNKLMGSDIHLAFRIYILSLNLPIRPTLREQGAQCSENDPYIDIDDNELGVTRLCGNSHTRYLLETCSNIINVHYNNINIGTGTTHYTGFQIYFESIQNDACRATSAPPNLTEPFVITNGVACSAPGRERVDFSCTPDYGLVFLQSHHLVTKNPKQCDVTQHICSYPSEQPQAQCSGQQACSYTHIIPLDPSLSLCQNKQVDSVEFYYQCLPMRPSSEFPKYTFCTDKQISAKSGFIETPFYPNTYEYGLQNCSLSIQLPDDINGANHSIFLYIIELSIRDTSIINSSAEIECFDSIKYTDGDELRSLCGIEDQPLLEYHTNKKELNLTLNISHASPSSEWNTWQGARLFFFIQNQSLPSPPTTPPSTTTPKVEETSTKPGPGSNNIGLITGLVMVGVLAIVAVLIGFGYYRRRVASRSRFMHTVKYDVPMDTIDGTTTSESKEKRTSIPTASLKAPSAIVSPFYRKASINGVQQTENATDA